MSDFEGSGIPEYAKSLPARILDRFGLVYGGGMSEFGLRHDGWGIPLHRRATLEESQEAARDMIIMLEEVQARSTPEAQ